ncbi:hypothetical protein Btru_075593 [Bulinus truncatus]|nr:hypothetical protein Btru_075593 [Bulinus truncatus]
MRRDEVIRDTDGSTISPNMDQVTKESNELTETEVGSLKKGYINESDKSLDNLVIDDVHKVIKDESSFHNKQRNDTSLLKLINQGEEQKKGKACYTTCLDIDRQYYTTCLDIDPQYYTTCLDIDPQYYTMCLKLILIPSTIQRVLILISVLYNVS